MNSRQLAILGGIALFLIAIAAWVGVSRSPEPPESAALYPALKGQLGKVTAIKVFKSGDTPVVEAVRDGADWKIKQRNGYPGDKSKINALLIALEDAEIREEKTSNPESYPALGVQDLTAADAPGTRIELTGIEPPVSLIVGKTDPTTRYSYVRRAGEKQSWLLSRALSAPTELSGWLQRDLVDIGADRIQEVVVQPAGSPRYTVFKKSRADANFDVTGIPKGRELNSVSAANPVAQSLTQLELDDVRPATELAGAKPAAVATFRTFDGLVVEVQGYTQDDKRWITLKPSFDEAQAKRFHLPTTAPAKPESGEAKAPDAKADSPTAEQSLNAAIEKGKAEADTLAKRLTAAYEVASFKYDGFFKSLEQMLKKKE